MEASELFEGAMEWLRGNYGDCLFYYEHEVVEKVEILLNQEIESKGLPYTVLKEYTLLPKTRADLVILNSDGTVEMAAEFKYEPARDRGTDRGGDIPHTRFPVVDAWKAIEKDVQRIQQYVEQWKAKAAYSVFINEGGGSHHRKPPQGSQWIDWGHGRWILWSQATRNNRRP